MATGTLAQRPPARAARVSSATVVDLVERAGDGDAAAWDALVEAFGGIVVAAARACRLCDEDVADVVQTTWLKLVEHLADLDDPACLPGWLATTARRAALRLVRNAGRTQPTSDEQAFAALCADEDALDALVARERDSAVRRAFDSLAERDRLLLGLLVAEPRPSYEQIAATLQVPVGTIGPTRARCLERLRIAALHAGAALVA
jgi:RNA polymerase sigma factor (sigma-70 family)